MEYLDISDENGAPTGEIVERTVAHEKGILHRTSHVWVLRRHGGAVWVLLQKRCMTKDSNPGCFDVSSAGHIPAGSDFVASALRELQEELGITASEDELVYCGRRRFFSKKQFYGRPFFDNQISNVYLLWRDIEAADIAFQKTEIASVCWMELDELEHKVLHNEIPHCIAIEELEMLKKKTTSHNKKG